MTVLRSGSATDVGRVRRVNQDLPLEAMNLFAVADGMGGHVGGEVAARMAVEALERAFSREPTATGLRDAFDEANMAVYREGQENGELRGMGTTLTAMALVGAPDGRDMLALANVGDSRAYVFSEGQIMQVTADHSLAEERMRHGEMTEEEAAVHPQRHILTRALGVAPEVDTDMWELRLRSSDRVIICSDGLSNEVGLEELAQVLEEVDDPQEAAQRLVEMANERGGADNITVVVVDVLVGEDGPESASVVTPVGRGAGEPLLIAADAAAAAAAGASPAPPGSVGDADTMIVPVVDSLAPGAQLGFSGQGPDLSSDGTRSGEFFPRTSEHTPLARTSVTVPPAPAPAAPPGGKETRRQRRRRLGIPRRITVRVILFILLVAAVPAAAWAVIRWYAYDNWYLAVQGTQIVIKQGQPGGVLWFKPKVVDHTGVTTAQVLPEGVADIHSGVQEPTLKAAKTYVTNLVNEYNYEKLGTTPAAGTGANTVGPNGIIPNITAPSTTTTSSTTTTVPGAAGATTSTTAATTTTTTTAPPSTSPT